MKIAIFTDRFEDGGVTTHIITLSKELMNRGHEILLYTAVVRPKYIEMVKRGSNSFSFMIWGDDPISDLKSFQPDIIHAHPFQSIRKGFQVAEALKKPFIITSHGLYPIGIDRTSKGKIKCEKVQRICAVDLRVALFLGKEVACPEKISIIRNGIDLETFFPFTLDSSEQKKLGVNLDWFTITSLGRLGDGKQVPIFQLLNCAQRIADQLGGLNLIVVGGGPYLTKLKQEAKSIPASKNLNIKIVGHKFNVTDYIACADLVFACGRAALEAMAFQRPVFPTYRDGFGEAINKKNYDRYLYYYQGYRHLTDDELIKEVFTIIEDEDYRKQIAKESFRIIKRHHDIKEIAFQMERLYMEYL